MDNALQVFLISLLTTAITSPFIMRLLISLKSRQTIHKDAPETHQLKAGTPTMGGLMVLLGTAAGLIIVQSWATLTLLVGFGLIGFTDDYIVPRMMSGKRGLGWMPKLAMQVLFGIAALWQLNLAPWALGTGLFFILFFTNAYNFADGLDGLAGLLGIFMALTIFMIHPSSVPLALLGGLIVFLFYNAPPAKVFMGDVGALAIGAVFGLLFMQATLPNSGSFLEYILSRRFWIMAIWSLVMIAELLPVPLQIFSVKVFKKKLFPYTPIHHAFEKAGWPETRVTFMFTMVQAACGIIAVLMMQEFSA